MPITITPYPPGTIVGPGLPFQLSSDFVGPMPTGSYWWFSLTSDDNGLHPIYEHQETFVSKQQSFWPWINNELTQNLLAQPIVQSSEPIYIQAELRDNTDTRQDVGASPAFTLDPTTGLSNVITAQAQTPVTLQTDQAAQLQTAADNTTQQQADWQQYTSVTLPSLQDVLNNIIGGITATVTSATGAVSSTLGQIFSGKTLDTLTTETLGSACAPDRIDVLLVPAIWYGVQVHITTVPDWYAFTAPGDTWTARDLAVITISRGGSQVYRAGVHSYTLEVYPLPGVPLVPMELDLPVTPPDYRIQVDFGEGVCGELVGLYLP